MLVLSAGETIDEDERDMEYRPLGRTGIEVSVIGLGTMTWGQQNSEAEAHDQLDAARDRGINLIDTAEMYPVPPKAETQGRTESYIGTWLRARGGRDKVILATKVNGRSDMTYLRGAETRLDRANIERAVEASLERLRTDTIDLYQLHWPDRKANRFGSLGYGHVADDDAVPVEETLAVLADLVRAGKLRYVGLSNETAWGTMAFVRAAASDAGLPRVASIQNPYGLLNRSFEVGLAEVALREDVGLLAYSPLGMGMLTGKYLNGANPAGARLTLFSHYKRYRTAAGEKAAAEYVALARASGLDPAQMALAYVASRDFVTSNLIGATTLDQLESDIASCEVGLSEEVLAGIEAIHTRFPYPCP